MIDRLLYFSAVDLAASDGPGTNEFEFTLSLSKRFGRNAWCVVKKPTCRVPHLDHMNTVYMPLPELNSGLKFLFARLRFAREISRLVRENRIDLVVGRLGNEPFVPWFLQRLFRMKVALKTVGRWWFDGPPRSNRDRVVRKVFESLSVSTLKNALAVDAGMEELVEKIARLKGVGSRVICIPNAVNTDHFQPAEILPVIPGCDLTGFWPVLGFVGTSPSLRGARQMVQVASSIRVDYPNVAVLVVGWDDGMEDVVDSARRLGIVERCHFPGVVPYGRVPLYVNRMTIGFSFFESWVTRRVGNASQKVRQYLACGMPVISIREGHAFLDNEELGSTVDPDNVAEIEIATRKWLKRLSEDATAIKSRLRQYAVEHLSTEQAMTERLRFWNECKNEIPRHNGRGEQVR